MLRSGWILCVAMVAFFLAGCGGGGGGAATSESAMEVRATLSALIQAATKGEAGIATVRDKLAAKEFDGILREAAPRPWDKATAEEKESATQGCFNQMLSVVRETTLRDAPSIDAALAAGKVSVLTRIRTADVEFQGPPADPKGKPVTYKAKLAKYPDGSWRLIRCEPQFGR